MAKVHITIPVSEEQREMLVQLASEQSMSLAAFCRERIMARENLHAEFQALQTSVLAAIAEAGRGQVAVTPSPQTKGEAPTTSDLAPLVAEVLLILRSMTPPSKLPAVHGELRRLGMEPFKN